MLGIALFLTLPTAGAVNLTVHVDTSKSTHVVDPLFMGVHMATCTRCRVYVLVQPMALRRVTCCLSLQAVTRIVGLRTPNVISTPR